MDKFEVKQEGALGNALEGLALGDKDGDDCRDAEVRANAHGIKERPCEFPKSLLDPNFRQQHSPLFGA